MNTRPPGLLLVGCGKMGGALLSGWLARKIATGPIHVVEPSSASLAAFRARADIAFHADVSEIADDAAPAVVLFAVKPQGMEKIVPAYRRFVRPRTVFLSIAAGRTIGFFESHLGRAAAVVRAMPNTPAAVARAITVATANARVTESQKAQCNALLSAVGEVTWIAEEEQLDAVTAVSGSGPAYVFLLVECLAAAGVEAGLPAELAMRLARATIAGAGELLHRDGSPAAVLRQNVTSPGGTTAAALSILMAKDGLQPLLTRAVIAAAKRSRELAG